MHHSRSRKGCLTCRSKKVKCDEQTPKCRRCHRLDLQCEWAGQRPRPLARPRWKDTSMPVKILPKSPAKNANPYHDMFEAAGMWFPTFGVHSISSTHLLQDKSDSVPLWDDNSTFPNWPDNLPAEMGLLPDLFDMSVLEPSADTSAETHNSPMQVTWSPSPEPCLSFTDITIAHNIALSPSFLQTGNEAEALQYYTTVYPTMVITKTVSWSTFIIVLRNGSQEPMIMHLIMAAALMDLACLQKYNPKMCLAARSHAKAGMRLLSEAINNATPAKATNIMAASYLLYRYMAVEKDLDCAKVKKWSEHICAYVKSNRLYTLCTDPRSLESGLDNKVGSKDVSRHYGHLARLMTWTYYEDIAAGMAGYGGSLALYLSEYPERTREVQQHSTAELELSWGDEYPEKEMLDDVENAPILTFLHDVLAIYAEVAKLAQTPYTEDQRAELEQKIDKLESRSRSLIRLTTITTQPRSRIMLNADYMVPYLYALRIYCFRKFLKKEHLGTVTPPAVQAAMHSILQLAQRSLPRGALDPITARFQWPLLMAGIETTDNIHKEWVQSKLKTERVTKGFKKVLDVQEATGQRVPMSVFASILSGDRGTELSSLQM